MTRLVDTLVKATGLPERDILRIIANAPLRYKHYTIAKKTGGRRPIAHPAAELKVLQRAIVDHHLKLLPIHQAATAYRKGLSIKHNALAHASNGPIMKMDFKDFFSSIKSRDWHRYCDDRGLFENPLERYQVSQILFHRARRLPGLRLAIGAPSSPMLSNILMYQFDAMLSEILAKDYVTYTRYADDLTFSAKRTGYLTVVERAVAQALRRIDWPRLTINPRKTVVATMKYHRQITGLVLTNDGDVSIGREKKRLLRAAVHRAMSGEVEEEWLNWLKGNLAFVQGVEPEFIRRLNNHYRIDVLKDLTIG
jgi:RNA-directed DNA polymerase